MPITSFYTVGQDTVLPYQVESPRISQHLLPQGHGRDRGGRLPLNLIYLDLRSSKSAFVPR